MKKQFLLLVLMMLPFKAVSAIKGVNGIAYNVNTDTKTAEVIPHATKKYSGDIVIPATITVDGESYSVTSIGNNAFYYCNELTSITIGANVERISYGACSGCSALSKVVINSNALVSADQHVSSKFLYYFGSGVREYVVGEGITRIGNCAFATCSCLTSITLPNSLTDIGSKAFNDCSRLKTIIFGKNISSLEGKAFYYSQELKDVYCYAEQVPEAASGSFYASSCQYATLHVPANAIEAYRNAETWKNFGTIVALTDEDPKPTSIESVSSNVKTTERYYTIDGKQLSTSLRGLNIVKMSDGTMRKVMIK